MANIAKTAGQTATVGQTTTAGQTATSGQTETPGQTGNHSGGRAPQTFLGHQTTAHKGEPPATKPPAAAVLRGAHLVCVAGDSILLTREQSKPMSIPGGKPMDGESPVAALERELREKIPTIGLLPLNQMPWVSFARRGSMLSGKTESIFFLIDDPVVCKEVVRACRHDNVPYKWLDIRTVGDRECAPWVDVHFAFLKSLVWQLAADEDARVDHYSARGVWPGPVVLFRPSSTLLHGGPSAWQHDPVQDGDVQPNPGPEYPVPVQVDVTAPGPGFTSTTIYTYTAPVTLEFFGYTSVAGSGTALIRWWNGSFNTQIYEAPILPDRLFSFKYSLTSGELRWYADAGDSIHCVISVAPTTPTAVSVSNWPTEQPVAVTSIAPQNVPFWTSSVSAGATTPVLIAAKAGKIPDPSYTAAPPPVPAAAPRIHTSGTTRTSSGSRSVEWDPGPFAHPIRGLKRSNRLAALPRPLLAPQLMIADKPIHLQGAATGGAVLNDVWNYRQDLLEHLRRKAGDGCPIKDREIVAGVAFTILADYNPYDLLPLEFGDCDDSVFEDCEERTPSTETDKGDGRPEPRKAHAPPVARERLEAAARRPRRSLAKRDEPGVAPAAATAPVTVPAGVSAAQCAAVLEHGNSVRRDHNSWLMQVAKTALKIKDIHALLCWSLGTGAPQKFIDAVVAKWRAEHDLRDYCDSARLLNLVEQHAPLIDLFDAAMLHDQSTLKSHWAYDALREYIADAPVSTTNPVHAAGISRGDLLVGVELNPGPEDFAPAPRVDADLDAAPSTRVLRESSSQAEPSANRWGPIAKVLTRLSTLTPGVNPLAGNLSAVVGFNSRMSLPDGTVSAPFAIPPPVTNLLPRAYFPEAGGAAVGAVARPRWIEVADVNRQGAPLAETPLGIALRENVDAAASARKNVNTLLFNGFPGGDLTNFDLGNADRVGLSLEAFFLKLWLYYFSDTVMSGSNGRNRFGVMSQNSDPNHIPVPANAVAYSVNTGVLHGEDCGGMAPNFPGLARDANATLQLHICQASIAPGDLADTVVIPPGLIRGHLDPNVALAMYVQGVAPYPCVLPFYTTTGTDIAGANATAVSYIPYSALVRINGKRQIRLYLPRVGGDGSAVGNVAQATAIIGARVCTGPFATAAYAAGTPMNVYAVGAGGTAVILSDYLRSWSSNATNTGPAIAPNLRLSFIKEMCRLFPGATCFAQSAYHKAVALSWRTVPSHFQAPAALLPLPAEAFETAPCTLCGRVPPLGAADATAEMPRIGAMVEVPAVQNNVFNGLALGLLVFAKAEPCAEALPPWSADNLFPHYALWDYVARAAAWDVWYGSLALDVQTWTAGRTANTTLELARQISLRSWNTSDDPMSHSLRHARCGLIATVTGSMEPWGDGSMPYGASLLWSDEAPFKPVYRVTAGPTFTAQLGVIPQRIADVWVFLTCPNVPREYLPRIPGGTWGPLKWRDWKSCSHATPVGGWSPPYPSAARELLWRTNVAPPCDDVWRYNNALAWEAGVTAASPLSPLAPTWLAGGAAVVYALPPSTDVYVRALRPANPSLPTDDPTVLSPPTQPRNWMPLIDADGRVVWLVFASAGGNAQAMALWGAEQRGTSTYAWAYSGMVRQQIPTGDDIASIDAALVSMFRAASKEPGESPAAVAGLMGAPSHPGVPQP